MSMFVPKCWLNIRILLAGFKQLLRQTWDHQNIHTYPPLKRIRPVIFQSYLIYLQEREYYNKNTYMYYKFIQQHFSVKSSDLRFTVNKAL